MIYMWMKIYSNVHSLIFFGIFKEDLFSLYIIDWYRVNYDTYENRVEHLKDKFMIFPLFLEWKVSLLNNL